MYGTDYISVRAIEQLIYWLHLLASFVGFILFAVNGMTYWEHSAGIARFSGKNAVSETHAHTGYFIYIAGNGDVA